jgi:predicted carbohydrate-binding protein with CBM5 and CBM33 domain
LAAALCGVPLVVFLLPASPANAHGSMSNPASRVYNCWREGPEAPKSAACKAVVAAGGTQPLYDWNEVNLANVAGRHREMIPDGKLCSAGREKYRGLDLLRSDWPATRISAGSRTLTYHATAPHLYGKFTFYITRSGWSPTQPLRWSDLVQMAEFTQASPSWSWTMNVPSRTGRALIYSIWQRYNGSGEAFYICSDVDFGGGGSPDPAPDPPAPPPAPPAPAPQPGGTWQPDIAYGRRPDAPARVEEDRSGPW